MNCDALSLTGERAVVASSIHLLRQIMNDTTGTFDTTLEDIDVIFLHTRDLLATFDETSNQPASAQSIATWIVAILNTYRRSNVLIQMSEIDNLLVFSTITDCLRIRFFQPSKPIHCNTRKTVLTMTCLRAFWNWKIV